MFQAFKDASEILEKLKNEYTCHSRGLFILAPSGSGKTHFVKNQIKRDWIDGDELWLMTDAMPYSPWWTQGMEVIDEVEQKCDIITQQAKKQGLWIMGASNYWLMPDAIVLPPWSKHKKMIIHREQNNYDGGAKSDAFDQVLGHRARMKKIARKHKIPVFKSIEEATTFLEHKQ